MKKLITIGIAALVLGLVLSVPLRVNALEDEKSIPEGEITEPRRSSPLVEGLMYSVGTIVGVSLYMLATSLMGLIIVLIGIAFLFSIIGSPIGLFFIIFGLFVVIMSIAIEIAGAIFSLLIFIIGLWEEITNMPRSIGNYILRAMNSMSPCRTWMVHCPGE